MKDLMANVGGIDWHSQLSLRKGDDLALSRAAAITADNMREYYSLLQATLEEHGILNCPSQIYNMDESGLPLDHKPPKVIARKGAKKFIVHQGNNCDCMYQCCWQYYSPYDHI